MTWMFQGLQASRNRIYKSTTDSKGFWWISSYSWINQLSIFNEFTFILHFKPLCCICIICYLFLFLGLVRLMSQSWPVFACLHYHHIFDNRYALFSVMGWFHLFWLSRISGWQIGRNDSAWVTCSLSVSDFIIFTHRLIVDQRLLLINKHKIRE